MILIHNVLKKPIQLYNLKRPLFRWVNLQFNAVDEDRRKTLGPDRTCAEWILRNGGAVKWIGSKKMLSDYNDLPTEATTLYLQEVDASNSSIMHNGFAHFKGCRYITKLIFHNCFYLEDEAFEDLSYLSTSLLILHISNCPNITEKGLLHLTVLNKLRELNLHNLIYVKNNDGVMQALKSSLPKCNIKFN